MDVHPRKSDREVPMKMSFGLAVQKLMGIRGVYRIVIPNRGRLGFPPVSMNKSLFVDEMHHLRNQAEVTRGSYHTQQGALDFPEGSSADFELP